jgi:hypothetical protein
MKLKYEAPDRIILGFTLRDGTQQTVRRIWTPDIRRTHLLNEATPFPITADPLMLPEVLELEPSRSPDGKWAVNPAGLVARLAYFDKLCASVPLSADHLSLALTTSPEHASLIAERWGFPDDPARAARESELDRKEWTLLGFDCVDFNGVVSGLFDCGFKDKPNWTERFGPMLNGYGLFHDPSSAAAFAKRQDGEVPKHAPFLVSGLLVRGRLPSWSSAERESASDGA